MNVPVPPVRIKWITRERNSCERGLAATFSYYEKSFLRYIIFAQNFISLGYPLFHFNESLSTIEVS